MLNNIILFKVCNYMNSDNLSPIKSKLTVTDNDDRMFSKCWMINMVLECFSNTGPYTKCNDLIQYYNQLSGCTRKPCQQGWSCNCGKRK